MLHPAPSVIHDYLVHLDGGSSRLLLRFSVSPQLVPQVYRKIDTDGDGKASAQERQAWLDNYLSGMSFTVDDKPVPFSLAGASPRMDQPLLLVSMEHPITATMDFSYTLTPDPPARPPTQHHLVLSDNTNYVGYDEYYSSWDDPPGWTVTSHDLTRPANPATFEAVLEQNPGVLAVNSPPTEIAPGQGAGNAQPQESAGSSYAEQLSAFLSDPNANTLFGVFLFLLAVGLGGLHALTPGHGKAVVAAYLVGSRGRVRDAVALGSIVTLTHTSSVIALGLVLLSVRVFMLPRWFQPALELTSGLMIVMLGLYLLAVRLQALRRAQPALNPDTLEAHAHSHESGPGGHTHDHGPGGHSHVPPPGGSVRDIVALGVSGGLVPCPDALTILFLTLPIGQVGLGLLLVGSFSFGLALVLIAIGVMMVKARGLLERLLPGGESGPGWIRLLPVASAVVVVVLGTALMLGAALGQKWV